MPIRSWNVSDAIPILWKCKKHPLIGNNKVSVISDGITWSLTTHTSQGQISSEKYCAMVLHFMFAHGQ